MRLVTYVHIDINSITIRRDTTVIGHLGTSIKSGKIGNVIKSLGVSVAVGLLLGNGALRTIKRNLPESTKKQRRIVGMIIVLGVLMTMMGFQAYNNNVFKVRYRYANPMGESSELSSSVINPSGFKIRRFSSPHDYMVRLLGDNNFEIRNEQDDVEFTTKDHSYLCTTSGEKYIGSFLKILHTVTLRVEYEDTVMENKEDVVILAATMTYLKDKLRITNIIGGLNVLGFAVPALLIVRQWPSIEKAVTAQTDTPEIPQ